MPAIPGAADAFVVATVDPPRDFVLTVPDGRGGNAVAWEHVLDALPDGRTRLLVRGRASSHWLDRARTTPPDRHRRIFENWSTKVRQVILLEGGSEERDAVGWMREYAKPPIGPALRELSWEVQAVGTGVLAVAWLAALGASAGQTAG